MIPMMNLIFFNTIAFIRWMVLISSRINMFLGVCFCRTDNMWLEKRLSPSPTSQICYIDIRTVSTGGGPTRWGTIRRIASAVSTFRRRQIHRIHALTSRWTSSTVTMWMLGRTSITWRWAGTAASKTSTATRRWRGSGRRNWERRSGL